MPAFFDVWMVGGAFLDAIFGKFQEHQNAAIMDRRKPDTPSMYLTDRFNVKLSTYHSSSQPAISRILNATIEALNTEHRLPKMLIIIIDKDIINDLKDEDFDYGANKCLTLNINWLFKQIDIAVRRTRLQILEKRPGAVNGNDPKIIYVQMVIRVEHYKNNSKMAKICGLRSKFNELLSEAAGRFNAYILSIRSCTGPEYFDHLGNLSAKGKDAFWWELDELIEKFEANQVKLLPCTRLDQHSNNRINRRFPHQHSFHRQRSNRNAHSETLDERSNHFISEATGYDKRCQSSSDRCFVLP